jgi:predicted DCC family thiol-disulfide oxidoreductase YuxK
MKDAERPPRETIFYDGDCGLCHRSVRFVLAVDRKGEAFRFAPLGGAAFRERVPAAERSGLPDSVVVQTADRRLLVRSAAALHVLRRLGGPWRLAAAVIGFVPRPLLDWLYDRVASVRLRLFRPPADVCPALSESQRQRFLL